MAAPIKINPQTAFKRDSFWLVPAIADVTAPSATEVNAAGGIYATCSLLAEQGGAEKTVNKVQRASLLCEDKTYESLAPASITHPDLMGAFSPQAPDTDDDKALFEFLRGGYTGFLVRRQGIANDVDDQVVSGEFVDVFPVDIDSAWATKNGTGPEAIYQFVAGVAVTGEPGINVAVAV